MLTMAIPDVEILAAHLFTNHNIFLIFKKTNVYGKPTSMGQERGHNK